MNDEDIEPDALIDKHGKPETRAKYLDEGCALLACGGHKGSGLSILIDVAACMLSGNIPATMSKSVNGNGTIIMAVDSWRFVGLDIFRILTE